MQLLRLEILLCLFVATVANADPEPDSAQVRYIANMGAMVERGDTKILFDPLFHYEHDTYHRVPEHIEAALLAGQEPWGGIDAVFISHHHGDHMDPATIVKLMRAQPSIELFGPEQAAEALRALVADPLDPLLKRVHGLTLENGIAATDIEIEGLLIEAARIRHAGWPDYHADIENIVFRVTIDNETTVTHLGDADTDIAHFAKSPDHWKERHSHLALPPYWFFLSEEGRKILEEYIGSDHTIGMHLPAEMPETVPDELQEVDLFTEPGETRDLEGR